MANKPKVQLSQLLTNVLISEGLDPLDFADYFADYKTDWPKYEERDEYFGKDCAYRTPTRNNKMVLMHVHMKPERNPGVVFAWELAAKNNEPRTSNSVLIYAHDKTHGYLLLHLVREPKGHNFARMLNEHDKKTMNALADAAEEFLFNGKILI